jgi:hypothetical protein
MFQDFDLTEQDEVLIAQRYPETEGDADKLNEKRRKATYRNFVVRNYGHLGPGIRRPIPSCCVWKIRDKFPDSSSQYCGFVVNKQHNKTMI